MHTNFSELHEVFRHNLAQLQCHLICVHLTTRNKKTKSPYNIQKEIAWTQMLSQMSQTGILGLDLMEYIVTFI